MIDPPMQPWTEAERLAALRRYAILDTPLEQDFDDLVRMAAELLGAPIAAVNLIDEHRQWFKAEVGLGVREMPVDDSICAQMLLETGELVVPDLLQDQRFACNPLVNAGSGLRFYAGELLETPDRLPLGTLCVLDTAPRPGGLTRQQRFALKTLARQVMNQLDLRRSLAEQVRSEALQRQVLDSAVDLAVVSIGLDGRITGWNVGATNILGWTEAEMLAQPAEAIFVPEDRAAGLPQREFARALADGQAADEQWHQRKDGSRFWAAGQMLPLRDTDGSHTGYLKMLRDRTEQHLAGEALQAVNERFRLSQQAARDAIWDWDLRHNSVLWNDALREGYGWLPSQVEPTGDWWIEQVHPEDRDRIDRHIHAVIHGTETSWTEEYRFRRADGSYAMVLDRGSVIRDHDGVATRMIGAMLNITERKLAETALADSQAETDRQRRHYEAILTNTPDLAYIWGLDHRFIYANEVLLRLWGRTWDEAIGRNCLELGYPEWHAAMHDREIDQVVATKQPVKGEVPFAGAFGRRIYEYILVPVLGESGEVEAIAGTTRDVTDRREIEEAQQELNELLEGQVAERTAELTIYRNIVQSNEAPICAFDHGFRLIAFNRAHSDEFFRIFGRRVRLGDVFPDQVPPDQGAIMRGFMARALAGEAYTVAEEFGDPDLAKPCWEVTYAPLLDADGKVIGAFHYARDISLRLKAEAELAVTQDALRQAQKMEAVGQLTGGLAHDFNNLLTGITGSLELLEARVAKGRLNDLDRYLAAAQGAAKRAAALTHRLLAFSRRQTLDPKPTDVNRLATDMVELLRRTVGPEIAVKLVQASDLWLTLIDPPQLENALLNLCINARDALPGGGHVTVETANQWLDERAASEHGISPGQYLSVCVTDDGVGMTPEVAARAFDPFFTTKPLGQGTGLGLSMIYGFVRQSGGQVRIASAPGRGTTVSLYLPRYHGEAEPSPFQPTITSARRAPEAYTVLVVDDEAVVRMLVAEVLYELGYASVEAADGLSGLKILESDLRIDLLVSDVGMPGMNGRQLADAARILRPDLRILFITGYAENAAIGNGNLEPGMHVMTKPFAMEALANKIQDLVVR